MDGPTGKGDRSRLLEKPRRAASALIKFAALRTFDLCEGLALVRRCCSPSDGEHLVAAIAVLARKQGRDPLGILLRLRCGREKPEPNRQRLGPVHSDLPGAALVRKENDIVMAFIDVVQQAEEDVHGLTHLCRITLRGIAHTAIKEPKVLGNPRARPSGLLGIV